MPRYYCVLLKRFVPTPPGVSPEAAGLSVSSSHVANMAAPQTSARDTPMSSNPEHVASDEQKGLMPATIHRRMSLAGHAATCDSPLPRLTLSPSTGLRRGT